jgi:hypothetical protein
MAHPGEVLQGFVTARMQVPAPELSSEVAGGLGTRRRTEVDEVLPPAMLRPPGSKRIAQTVEPFVWVGPAPILIFAVDNLRLLRMKRQPTLGKPLLQLLPQALCLRLRLTMTNRVIGIPFDRDVRVVPLPPPIERIMHEEIRQQRAPYPSYKVANMLVECSTSIPRIQRRPGDGDGVLGAPLRDGAARASPTRREQGGRGGTSRTPTPHATGGARHVCTEPRQPRLCRAGVRTRRTPHVPHGGGGLPPEPGWASSGACGAEAPWRREAHRRSPPPAAMYARGSSEQQAEAHTVASQVAAVRERVAAAGLPLPEALPFLAEGDRGATLVRPALERRRDVVAAGAVDRL